jgi:hypothetical protein
LRDRFDPLAPIDIRKIYLPIISNPDIRCDASIAVDRIALPLEANGDHAFTMT